VRPRRRQAGDRAADRRARALRRRLGGADRPDRLRHPLPDQPPLPLFLAAGGRRPRLVPIPADRSSGGAWAVSRRASSPRRAGYSRWWRLPVVETQEEWIAAVLTGRLRLPPRAQMDWAIERAERRTRQRFPQESPRSVRCGPHAYRRLLHSDLRRARRRVWHVATATDAGHESAVRPRRTQGMRSPCDRSARGENSQPREENRTVTAMKEEATWRDPALGDARELELPRGGCATSRPVAGRRSSSRTGYW
jgi:hypothetical protein